MRLPSPIEMLLFAIAFAPNFLNADEPPQEDRVLPANPYNITRFLMKSMGEQFDLEGSVIEWINLYEPGLQSAVRRNEFERPQAFEEGITRMRAAAADAPTRLVWSGQLNLGEYDFAKQAFPIVEFQGQPGLGVARDSAAPREDYGMIPSNIDSFRFLPMPKEIARDFVKHELRDGIQRDLTAQIIVDLIRAMPDHKRCRSIREYCRVEVHIAKITLLGGLPNSRSAEWDGVHMLLSEPVASKSRQR